MWNKRKILRTIKREKIGVKCLAVILVGVLLFSSNSFVAMAQTVSENTEINAVYTEDAKREKQVSPESRTQIEQNVGTENDDDNTISLNYTSLELELGEIERACPGIEGSHPDEYWNDIVWTSSDETVAVIISPSNGYGEYVQAISAGNCTITAYLASKPEVRATCDVKVYDSTTNISLNQSEIELEAYASVQLNATILPRSAKQDIIWRTSNTSVATVDENGVVTATGNENAVCQIYAFSSTRKLFAVCSVKVLGEDVSSPTIQDGYIVKPIQDGDLFWSIDAKGHLKISGNGNIEDDCSAAWLNYTNYIKSAEVDASGMDSTAWWFGGCKYLTDIDISNLDTSNVTDMYGMFYGCASLMSIVGIDKLNTSNVTSMEYMFRGCSSIDELNLSSFDTAKVVEIYGIFEGCSNLKKLNLSGWTFDWSEDSGNKMFQECFSLTELNLSKTKITCSEIWDVADLLAIDSDKVQTYEGPAESLDTRYYCPVKHINFSEAEFTNCMDLSFGEDIWLESVDLSNIKVDNLKCMNGMFYECSELKEINLSGVDTSNVRDMTDMFYGCSGLKELDINNFNTAQVESMTGMFSGCSNLQELQVENFDTQNVDNMEEMFSGCKSLHSLDLSSFIIQEECALGDIFTECIGLETIELPVCSYTLKAYSDSDEKYVDYYDLFILPENDGYYWKNEKGYKCVSMGEGGTVTRVKCDRSQMVMYGGISGLSNWTINFDRTMEINGNGAYNRNDYERNFISEYYTGDGLWYKDVKKIIFNLSEFSDVYSLFMGMDNLEEVDFGNTNTSQTTSLQSLFSCCKTLKKVNLSNFNTQNVTNMNAMFYGCESLKNVDVSRFNTKNVKDMNCMFADCKSLEGLSVANFDTSSVTDMGGMFANCKNLESLSVANFDTSNVTDMRGMFSGCENLRNIDVSRFKTKNVKDMGGMFANCKNLESLSVANFDTNNVTNINGMFANCEKLTKLDISNFDMRNLPKDKTNGVLDGCNSLTEVIAPANAVTIVLPETEGYSWVCEIGQTKTAVCTYIWSGYSKPLTYKKVPNNSLPSSVTKGTKITGSAVTSTTGTVPATATFTVTSSDPKNPTVSFDGVENENAKPINIPEYITYNGVQYKVTTVSATSFKKTDNKYKVTDNSIKNPTVAYTGTTNKKKKSVSIPQYVNYKGVKYKVSSVNAKSFKGNKKLTTVKIASGITKIGDSAFEGCTNLKTVVIGTGLKMIGKNAFKNCKKLKKLTIKSSKLKTVGKNAFKGINSKCKIKVPSKKVKAYKKLFKKKGQKSTVKITKY